MEYKFKAVIEGFVQGENYMDAMQNIGIPGMINEISRIKIKNVELVESVNEDDLDNE